MNGPHAVETEVADAKVHELVEVLRIGQQGERGTADHLVVAEVRLRLDVVAEFVREPDGAQPLGLGHADVRSRSLALVVVEPGRGHERRDAGECRHRCVGTELREELHEPVIAVARRDVKRRRTAVADGSGARA